MPIDISAGSFAAWTIASLFWWTVLSPATLLAVAALCAQRPRLRGALTIAVLTPPLLTLLPVAVLRDGLAAALAAVAALVIGGALVLAVTSLPHAGGDTPRSERRATAAFVAGVTGGMSGSAALVLARLWT